MRSARDGPCTAWVTAKTVKWDDAEGEAECGGCCASLSHPRGLLGGSGGCGHVQGRVGDVRAGHARMGCGGRPVVVTIMSGCSPTTSPVGMAPNRVRCHRGWQWHLSHSSWSDDLSGCYPATWLFGIAPKCRCLGSGINIDPRGTTVFSGTSSAHWLILMERQFSVAPAVRTG